LTAIIIVKLYSVHNACFICSPLAGRGLEDSIKLFVAGLPVLNFISLSTMGDAKELLRPVLFFYHFLVVQKCYRKAKIYLV